METSEIASPELMIILIPLALWEIAWKGFALWRAAHANDKAWYIVILIVNSVGILPILYLLTHRRSKTAA